MTQVVGSALFGGRRIYSRARGDPARLAKPVFSAKLPRQAGYKQIPLFRGEPKKQDGSVQVWGADGGGLGLGMRPFPPRPAGLAEQPGKW